MSAELDKNLISQTETNQTEQIDESKNKIDKYEPLLLLGSGKFGDVVYAKEFSNKNGVAIKLINKANVRDFKLSNEVKTEIQILEMVKHPFIIQMRDHFEDDDYVYIILEYCSKGDLYNLIKTYPINELRCKKYIKQLTEAVKYLHSMNIIHRDIKNDNILLFEDDNIKLCDFGWSIITERPQSYVCGTLDYMAPEIARRDFYNHKVDNWCIGVTTYELLTSGLPFDDSSDTKTLKNIMYSEVIFLDQISDIAKDFISKCLIKDFRLRLEIDQMLVHPFLT